MLSKSKVEKRLQGAVFHKSALAGIVKYLQSDKAEAKKRLKNPAVREVKEQGRIQDTGDLKVLYNVNLSLTQQAGYEKFSFNAR